MIDFSFAKVPYGFGEDYRLHFAALLPHDVQEGRVDLGVPLRLGGGTLRSSFFLFLCVFDGHALL